MHKSRSIITVVLVFIVCIWIRPAIGKTGWGHTVAKAVYALVDTDIQVNLYATHNTISWDARVAEQEKFTLPVVYLHRERDNTSNLERTLEIHISGLSGGEEIILEILSRHVDITTGFPHIVTQHITLPDRNCSSDNPCVIRWTFKPQTTPSDFYALHVRDKDGHLLWQNPYGDRPDFVMLDTWDVDIDDYTVRIIYATLFPFAKGQNDIENRLSPTAVTAFIEQKFVSIITDTWHTQFHVWGLGNPMHPAWDADKIMEIIITDTPFALSGDIGLRSHFINQDNQPTKECCLWWASNSDTFQAYSTLEDAFKAVYSHEFFHLVQRNVLLFTDHPEYRLMNLLIEAQGKFAPSVQYPDMEVRRYRVLSMHQSEYLVAANHFLTQRLNTPYRDLEAARINKYDYALYWRFLYEQYGDMDVIRTTLLEMTKGYSDNIVPAIKTVMNQTFAQHEGLFVSFEDSLIAFARANYALHLQDGRCKETDFTQCDGFYYDPSNNYAEPPLEAELFYNNSPIIYQGAIPASYGMDFIEIILEHRSYQHPVLISVQGLGGITKFNVQLWKVLRACPKQYAITKYPEIIPQQSEGIHTYIEPIQEFLDYDKLVLIITRLDAHELADPNGNYTVSVAGY